jgi:hypothetical protein
MNFRRSIRSLAYLRSSNPRYCIMVNPGVCAFVSFRFSRGHAFFPPQSCKLRVLCYLKSCFSSFLSIKPSGVILLCVASSGFRFCSHSPLKYVTPITHTSDQSHSSAFKTMVRVNLSCVSRAETSRQEGRGIVEGIGERKP